MWAAVASKNRNLQRQSEEITMERDHLESSLMPFSPRGKIQHPLGSSSRRKSSLAVLATRHQVDEDLSSSMSGKGMPVCARACGGTLVCLHTCKGVHVKV